MKISVSSPGNLAEQLRAKGFHLDLRCCGHGRCGGCRVKLVSGEWECNGVPAFPPETVPACRTRLIGGRGVVEIPERSVATVPERLPGCAFIPLPDTPETVIAVDLGSTTLEAVKIRSGKVIGSAGAFNRQIRYGDNVVTRIAHAARPNGARELQNAVIDSLRELLEELDADGVDRIAVSGNTVMCCLLHGVDPSAIGVYPFAPPQCEFPPRRDLLPPCEVWTVPCISGYLGGDITSGLFAAKLQPGEMLVDLGTNCEIVFNTGNGFIGTSAAAGPAFEGAGLRCGMRASAGAIEHYAAGQGGCRIIGGVAARGICGTAYVDYLAEERAAGRLNEFGRFVRPEETYREIAPGVGVGEDDVEQLLKAKAAIGAGIAALEEHCGITADKLVLAGGFASGLALKNAIAIGMLPQQRKLEKIGNSSLHGAAALAAEPE
ncbi:MAG: DUF4445 domain-containing protein, partial [Lentisphaeria bacterium]|nr:DUF4445 domain-containing protein [Lentisphaeria bacterium]